MVKRDDGRPPGERARDLDRVLHSLGARVEQGGALLALAGGQFIEALGDLEVLLVGRDHEAGVGEVLDLRLHGRDHSWRRVAHGGDRDSGAEVDQVVAVDVDEDAAAGPLDVDRQTGSDPGRDGRQLAFMEQLRAGPWDRRRQDPSLFDGGIRHRVLLGRGLCAGVLHPARTMFRQPYDVVQYLSGTRVLPWNLGALTRHTSRMV